MVNGWLQHGPPLDPMGKSPANEVMKTILKNGWWLDVAVMRNEMIDLYMVNDGQSWRISIDRWEIDMEHHGTPMIGGETMLSQAFLPIFSSINAVILVCLWRINQNLLGCTPYRPSFMYWQVCRGIDTKEWDPNCTRFCLVDIVLSTSAFTVCIYVSGSCCLMIGVIEHHIEVSRNTPHIGSNTYNGIEQYYQQYGI